MFAVSTREPTLAELIRGVPLSVVFADGELIAAVRERGEGMLPLDPPFHVSDEDAYLVLPIDIGLELVDMFRDGDVDLLEEAMRDGLVAIGTIEKQGRGKLALAVEQCAQPSELMKDLPFAETVGIGRNVDPLEVLNELEHVQCTVASGFVDEEGLESMLSEREFAGLSWRVPEGDKQRAHVDPTYVWSKRLPDGRIAIECALFSEYEELVAVLRPVALAPLDRPRLSAV
ncbi:hypothetical protein [Sandaracinus amylolyticus]|uniref:hypothetical protein n=1 Tax=Sandaracinus amylolyticus TaxID=927083 RepID=UPI00069F68C8|nr:hypothetical protein [Sandaracinus amylolyticus]